MPDDVLPGVPGVRFGVAAPGPVVGVVPGEVVPPVLGVAPEDGVLPVPDWLPGVGVSRSASRPVVPTPVPAVPLEGEVGAQSGLAGMFRAAGAPLE